MEPKETFVARPDFENDPNYAFAQDSTPVLLNQEPTEIDQFDERYASDIEGLIYLGALEHSFEYLGHSFIVRTLRSGERLAALILVKEYEDTLGLEQALQNVMVAASIEMVDGRVLAAPLGPAEDNPLARISANLEIVNRWYDPVISAIYDECSELLLRQQAAIKELEGKYSAGR